MDGLCLGIPVFVLVEGLEGVPDLPELAGVEVAGDEEEAGLEEVRGLREALEPARDNGRLRCLFDIRLANEDFGIL